MNKLFKRFTILVCLLLAFSLNTIPDNFQPTSRGHYQIIETRN